MYKIDLTGKKNNKLTIVRYSHKTKCGTYWDAICECGNNIKIRGSHFKNGHTKTCGCSKEKHGATGTTIYIAWKAIKRRCHNANNDKYKDYGGRGITVCDKWLTFNGFYEDMGDQPEGHTIDRIDVNGNYCKENCRWATREQQDNNKRNSVKITYNNKTQTVTQWSKELGVTKDYLRGRLIRSNYSVNEVINKILNIQKDTALNGSVFSAFI